MLCSYSRGYGHLKVKGGDKIPIKINGQTLNIDVRSELERYDWNNARWTDTKLIAASPFRYDKHPSFFVDYDDDSEYYGCWADSGALDDCYKSGNFIKLLSFLRNETYEETEDYLLLMYSTEYSGDIKLPPLKLPLKSHRTPLDESLLRPYMFRHKYLEKRGISEPVQRLMGVGYDRQRRAITMPWRLPDGGLANIKYRRVDNKVFWYEKGGLPVKDLVYGIDVIYKKRLDTAVICEGEIDAMSYMTEGIPAIAIGGGTFSDKRKELIIKSPIKTLYISTDNDTVGLQLKEESFNSL